MLQTLILRDFVIVDQLELDFAAGFTVLTGETGAGKSILLDALSLVLGERADSSQIREGCKRGEISAFFRLEPQLQPSLQNWLEEQGFPLEDNGESLILKRIIETNGRSRAFINGSVATLIQLRQAGDQLVDIHGQHAHQLLLKGGAQRDLLDHHAGLSALAKNVAEHFRLWNDSRRRLAQAENAGQDMQRERERLTWQLEELQALSPQEGEWLTIQSDHARLANAAKIISGCQAVIDGLSEVENSVASVLSKSSVEIQALSTHDSKLAEIGTTLEAAQIQIDEAVHSLTRYLQKIELDPERLEETEARMQALHGAARKFKVLTEQLPQLLIETEDGLATLAAAQNIDLLKKQVATAKADFMKLAQQLSQQRLSMAKQLGQEVTAAMQGLSMAGGQLQISLLPLAEGNAGGLEQIEFLVAAHPGATPRPLAKVASGGELARISLAISVITSQAAFTPTLIFDEVDAGIGGAVAETVGRLLRQLGESHQILCVTHLPQVAAQGNQHLKVSKAVSKTPDQEKTLSHVSPLNRTERVEEIARMLGGSTLTETTRRHARELLEQH
ncbi:RecN ATPase involved in DNA repair [Burkholderiaceae bacterium]|jgi:DNA repair protein RecN (Recombination protein N)